MLKGIKVVPCNRLCGEVTIQGSKNAALPVMAASLLHDGFTIIKNCPRITDVDYMALLLTDAGCRVFWQGDMLVIDAKNAQKTTVNDRLAGQLRASVLMLGALFGRFQEAVLPLPGGCNIGKRPVDMHIAAMEELGAKIHTKNDAVLEVCGTLKAGNIHFRTKSVGATENALIASVRAEGVTVIENAAMEPEVTELCNALINMGADIAGVGTETLVVTGVKELFDSVYTVSADRIVLGTYMAAVASTGGKVHFNNCLPSCAVGYLDVLCAVGLQIEVDDAGKGMFVSMEHRPVAVNCIQTAPYPGFPTDMQPIVMAVLARADGTSLLYENIFEKRLSMVSELQKMGACVCVQEHCVVMKGIEKLEGACLEAKDLRQSAALLIAALGADKESYISSNSYILRGYEDITRDMQKMGADVSFA